MEAMTWSEVSYRQAPLLKLSVAQESNRRDSLSSSRTGDSGYNSDPEISLSPLDFVGSDQVPHSSAAFTFDSSALFDVKEAVSSKTKQPSGNAANSFLFKKHKVVHQTSPEPKINVTSNPSATAEISNKIRPGWPKAPKESNSTSLHQDPASRKEDVEQWIEGSLHPQDNPKERKCSIVSLSSTGSCDMYSNTDDNSDEEDVLDASSNMLPKATLKTIELIMRKIEINLGYAAYMQCAGSQGSRGHGSTSNSSRGGRGNSQSSGSKRKTRYEDSLPPDDPDEDGSNKRRRVSITTTTEDSEAGPRFACPFYKHDPNRYRNRRTCPGPGWPTVHRMKEHLYRSHAQPIFCPRCYAMFDSDSEFSTHLRAHPSQCQISAPQPIEGIDRETLKSLRKRSPAGRLEEDKWRDTYQLLFPEVSTADIPSPFYDSDSPTEESRRFRRELLERIRTELFATAEHEPMGPAEQGLLRRVAAIIQRCESDLLSSFHSPQSHPSSSSRRPSSAIIPPPPSHLESDLSDPAQPPILQTPTFAPSFPPSRDENMSPRTGSFVQPPGASSMESGAGAGAAPAVPHELQLLPAPVAWSDPLQFSSSDWIDWSIVFPPGPEQGQGMGHERAENVTMSTPVWT